MFENINQTETDVKLAKLIISSKTLVFKPAITINHDFRCNKCKSYGRIRIKWDYFQNSVAQVLALEYIAVLLF